MPIFGLDACFEIHSRTHNMNGVYFVLNSGKRLHNHGKSSFLMGKSTISMAMFNSYVGLLEGI